MLDGSKEIRDQQMEVKVRGSSHPSFVCYTMVCGLLVLAHRLNDRRSKTSPKSSFQNLFLPHLIHVSACLSLLFCWCMAKVRGPGA
ncbi:hypothetical protein BKA70DRAFT_1319066 [Coprinopsis sp. MPI-PUGE-AT-0042]|nr:hypothetical protein BKA70DRAFT_1319066 [Coprinopsis sp. MPI-PUGE-AT-0042]